MYENFTFEKSKETLQQLVSINSISKNEAKLAQYICAKCERMGMDAKSTAMAIVLHERGSPLADRPHPEQSYGYGRYRRGMDKRSLWMRNARLTNVWPWR